MGWMGGMLGFEELGGKGWDCESINVMSDLVIRGLKGWGGFKLEGIDL